MSQVPPESDVERGKRMLNLFLAENQAGRTSPEIDFSSIPEPEFSDVESEPESEPEPEPEPEPERKAVPFATNVTQIHRPGQSSVFRILPVSASVDVSEVKNPEETSQIPTGPAEEELVVPPLGPIMRLERVLIKPEPKAVEITPNPSETSAMFELRKQLEPKISQIGYEANASSLARAIANKFIYGVVYNESLESLLVKILSNL